MPRADSAQVAHDWKIIKVRRETRVDAHSWREFVFLSADMHDVTAAVLVPVGQPATKKLAKRDRSRI